jgi:hypothetical protein
MSRPHRPIVSARRLIGRHPWIHWLVVGTVAIALAATVLDRLDRVADARESWGHTHAVWVAATEHRSGEPLDVVRRELPAAVVPDGAVAELEGLLARQRIGAGEIVTAVDVAPAAGARSLVPDGWLGVPVVESPRSGAGVGDRVSVASDGFVISSAAIVVALVDDVTVVAAPADEAPAIAAAGDASALTLLLEP